LTSIVLRKRFFELEKDFNGMGEQFEEFRKSAAEIDKGLESIGMELAIPVPQP